MRKGDKMRKGQDDEKGATRWKIIIIVIIIVRSY